jgi:hypothetical protein
MAKSGAPSALESRGVRTADDADPRVRHHNATAAWTERPLGSPLQIASRKQGPEPDGTRGLGKSTPLGSANTLGISTWGHALGRTHTGALSSPLALASLVLGSRRSETGLCEIVLANLPECAADMRPARRGVIGDNGFAAGLTAAPVSCCAGRSAGAQWPAEDLRRSFRPGRTKSWHCIHPPK